MNQVILTKIKAFLAKLDANEFAALKQHVDAGDFSAPLDLFEKNQAELKASLGLFSKLADFRKQLADEANKSLTPAGAK